MANEQVLNGFGCSGDNISPQLDWSGEPAGTKSFAVTVYDPDAPTGSGWWHWVVFNIPADINRLAKGITKKNMAQGAIQSRTDFGSPGYGGACPPAGDKPHRYTFTIWALDVDSLSLGREATAAMVGFFLHQHQLAKAELTVTFGR
ncbi:MAG: YbhB/YbcL family Raf kinase inhibitor-like protein [Thermodesulfobacteriota bacterium]